MEDFSSTTTALHAAWRECRLDEYFSHCRLDEETGSTMESSRELLAAALAEGSGDTPLRVASFALQQRLGRGRKGKPWISQPSVGIYVTYGWCFKERQPQTEALSLAIGIAVQRFCRKLKIAAELKWPNDVMVAVGSEYRKLAGVLVECSTRGVQHLEVYVGVGLNLAQQAFPQDVPGVSIAQLCGAPPAYPLACAGLSREIMAVIEQFFAEGFSNLLAEYNRYSIIAGAQVLPNGEQEWLHAVAVEGDGALRCICPSTGATRSIYSAEIKLVAPAAR